MTSTETPPENRERDDTDTTKRPSPASETATKIVVAIVAVAAVVALVAHFGYAWNPGDTVFQAPTKAAISAAPAEVTPKAATALPSAVPTRVSIPSLNANSSLIALGQKPDGSLAVPPLSNPMQASWYDKSPTPGTIGPAVILGHINGGGKEGIFAHLDGIAPGAQVMVDRADGQTAVFTVSHVDLVPKDNFPTSQVYGDTPDSQLRLITCGGELDQAAHSYKSNVVVYATLTSVHPT